MATLKSELMQGRAYPSYEHAEHAALFPGSAPTTTSASTNSTVTSRRRSTRRFSGANDIPKHAAR